MASKEGPKKPRRNVQEISQQTKFQVFARFPMHGWL